MNPEIEQSVAFGSPAVETVFASFPPDARTTLLRLRTLIFETAAAIAEVGPLQETLKRGEPAYLTASSKSGSTIRLGWKKSAPDVCAMYFNCQTTLIESFRLALPDEFCYESRRAIIFPLSQPLRDDAVCMCIAAALTYHSANQQASRSQHLASTSR